MAMSCLYQKMEEKLKNQLIEHFKTTEEEFNEAYKDAEEFVIAQYPNLEGDDKQNKILNSLRGRFSRKTNTSTYKGIVIGICENVDQQSYTRWVQQKAYDTLLKQAESEGNLALLDDITITRDELNEFVKDGATLYDNVSGKVAVKESDGSMSLLWPAKKNDGTPSKMAGQTLPSKIDSMRTPIIGMCYKVGDNAEEELKPFTLMLSGKALNASPTIGKVVQFKAGGNEYNGEYNLNSSMNSFDLVSDEYLDGGLENVGLPAMIENVMESKVVSFADVENWVKEYKETNENTVPKEYRYSYIVVKDCNTVSQNFDVDAKGKVGMNFVNNKFSLDNEVTMITKTYPVIGNMIEFAPTSNCVIVGNLSILGDVERPLAYMNLFGAFGVKDDMVDRVFDVEPITEEVSETTEVKEEVVETPKTNKW